MKKGVICLQILIISILSIVIFTALTFIHPLFAFIVGGGLLMGCAIRALYLLTKIYHTVVPIENRDPVKRAVEQHLAERNV